MGRRSVVSVLLAFLMLSNSLCLPMSVLRLRRQTSDSTDSTNASVTVENTTDTDKNNDANFDLPPPVPYSNDDDDDDDFVTYPSSTASNGGGSNLFSLLNLVTGLLPGSSSSSETLHNFLKAIVKYDKPKIKLDNEGINNDGTYIDYIGGSKPDRVLREKIDIEENSQKENVESDSNQSSDDSSSQESLENDEERNQSNDESNSNIDTSEEFDNEGDEPPGGGDGGGGGLLGLLAGLSGDEDGQSDLGSLLATVSGIIANLSGDGIDLNSLIASGIGLFVGLLSEGEKNPGEIIASYLLTSLDTITGGGAKNNGAFFGKFLTELLKGTSAAGDIDADSNENGNHMETKDSTAFFASFLMALLGDLSKSSSSGSDSLRRYFKKKPKHAYWMA